MLNGINPILTGELLAQLDAMGHSDSVVIADAHFPAERLGARVLNLPGLSAPQVVRAIRTVIPLDDQLSFDLMESADGALLPVQEDLIAAAGAGEGEIRFVERNDFYALAGASFLIVRTGEIRKYGNALLRKGVITAESGDAS